MRNDAFFQPVSALEVPRFAGMPSFMRLPHLTMQSAEIDRVDMGLVGVPWDAGTTNRPGPRHGPRQLRDLSTMIRAINPVTGINPFQLVNCADLGDVGPNPIDLQDSLDRISAERFEGRNWMRVRAGAPIRNAHCVHSSYPNGIGV